MAALDGWAFDPAEPDKKLKVEIWIDGTFGAVGEASLFREDLLQAGSRRRPRPFFHSSAGSGVYDGVEHTVTARIAGAAEPFGDANHDDSVASRHVGENRRGGGNGASRRGRVPLRRLARASISSSTTRKSARSPSPRTRERRRAMRACPRRARRQRPLVPVPQERRRPAGRRVRRRDDLMSRRPKRCLQRYARDFPGALSANAARRYKALAKQIELAPQFIARQAPRPDSLTLPEYLAQVARAHKQVMYGVNDRPGKPEPLTVLEYDDAKGQHRRSRAQQVLGDVQLHGGADPGAERGLRRNHHRRRRLDATRPPRSRRIVKGVTDRAQRDGAGLHPRLQSRRRIGARRIRRHAQQRHRARAPAGSTNCSTCSSISSDVGLVGAKLVYPDGKLQEAGGLIFHNLDVWNYGRGKNPHDPRFNYIRQVDYCSGACIMLRRELWRQLQGLRRILRARLLRGHRSRLPRARARTEDLLHAVRRDRAFRGRVERHLDVLGRQEISGDQRAEIPQPLGADDPAVSQAPGARSRQGSRRAAARARHRRRDAAARPRRRQLRRDPGNAAVAVARRQAELRAGESRLSRQLHRGASAHGRRMSLRAVPTPRSRA